ncbi:DUF645 family protein [Vibrio cholerae]
MPTSQVLALVVCLFDAFA